jgi:hypothetical protein
MTFTDLQDACAEALCGGGNRTIRIHKASVKDAFNKTSIGGGSFVASGYGSSNSFNIGSYTEG